VWEYLHFPTIGIADGAGGSSKDKISTEPTGGDEQPPFPAAHINVSPAL